GGDPVGDIHHRPFRVAVHQQVGLGIHDYRAAHLVRPVIVMGDPAQAGFDAADQDWHVVPGLAAALAVDDDGPVRAFATFIVGGIGVVVTQFAVGGVAVDHGIHVARGHRKKQIRFAQNLERLGAVPVRLGDDANPKSLIFQQPADHRHAEAGVIHIGVAADDDDVAAVPAQGVHLGTGHGQEWG